MFVYSIEGSTADHRYHEGARALAAIHLEQVVAIRYPEESEQSEAELWDELEDFGEVVPGYCWCSGFVVEVNIY